MLPFYEIQPCGFRTTVILTELALDSYVSNCNKTKKIASQLEIFQMGWPESNLSKLVSQLKI